jgi:glycosyltransferase involved in cell wall biosynthesis
MAGHAVLHIHKVAGISGSERHLSLLLPALRERGWDARILLLPVHEGRRAVELFRSLSVPVLTLPPGPDVNPLLVARIVRLLRSERPALVHTHLIHADIHGQLAAFLAQVPAVSSMHATHDFLTREPVRSGVRAALRLAARTIAISHHVEGFALHHRLVPAGRTRVVHYGIDIARWASPDRPAGEVRRGLGVDEGEVLVGIVARLVSFKGHEVLLEAFAAARRDVPGLRLAIAGDGPLRDRLQARAHALLPDGAVRFLGFTEDVPSLTAACDIIAFPTFSEGFGLAGLEAMAAGRPLIASDVDSLPEIVVDGVTGLLVPPGDAKALAAAIVRLAGDAALRRRLGEDGQRRARSDFSVGAMADRTVAVYEEALAGGESGWIRRRR